MGPLNRPLLANADSGSPWGQRRPPIHATPSQFIAVQGSLSSFGKNARLHRGFDEKGQSRTPAANCSFVVPMVSNSIFVYIFTFYLVFSLHIQSSSEDSTVIVTLIQICTNIMITNTLHRK